MPLRSRTRPARRFRPTPPALEQLEDRVLLSAGALDRSFGGDGVVTTSVLGLNTLGAMSVRPDGKIVDFETNHQGSFGIALTKMTIVRHNPDGSLDETFGDGGVADVSRSLWDLGFSGHAVTFQADGKILVGGQIPQSSGNDDFAVFRLNEDGSLDTSFGGGDGYVTVDLLVREFVTSIAVQPDGKIVLAGMTTLPTDEPAGRRTFVAIRLDADGALDTSFGDDGHVVVDAVTGVPAGAGLQSDGKILLVGGDVAVRLNADGTLDATFDGDGIAPLATGFDAGAVAVQTDGRILIGGTSNQQDFAAVRLTTDGSLDTAFGVGGLALVDFGDVSSFQAMALQADGRIVLVGSVNGEVVQTTYMAFQNSDLAVARLNQNGSLDTTFADGGSSRIGVDAGSGKGQHAVAVDVAVQADGRILIGGSSYQEWLGLSVHELGPTVLVRLLGSNAPSDVEIIGRNSDGQWHVGAADLDGGVMQDTLFTQWSASVDWRHVRTGDFDGDGLTDVAGWDPASGSWWTSLSDGEGSTTQLAGNWSNATVWSDVAAVDLAGPGDRGDQGHFTNTDDLIGRDQWGNWWGAVSNGDGTFTNVLLGAWNPAARWTDTQFLDINNDGAVDVVSRVVSGQWWALVSRGQPELGNLEYENVLIATWSGSAGWQDGLAADGLAEDGRPTIAARTFDGEWWALNFAADGTATTRSLGRWNEAAGWRDVQAADLDGDGRDELVGRTSTGEWWQSTFATPGGFASRSLGGWNEAAGWHDVQTAALEDGDALVGRTNGGGWWLSTLDPNDGLVDRAIGLWNPASGWRDVHVGTFTRPPVFARPSDTPGTTVIAIAGDRNGTTVGVRDGSRTNGDGSIETGLVVTRTVLGGSEREWFFAAVPATTLVRFQGHVGVDDFDNDSTFDSEAHGWAGDDRLDGKDNFAFDQLFGGDGLDVLLGDGTDLLVTDPPAVV